MKSLIIYYSYYNKNTEKIAKILADKTNAEIINLKETNIAVDLDSYDLIGFGSGVYNESLSPILYKAVEGWGYIIGVRYTISKIYNLKGALTVNNKVYDFERVKDI